MNNVALVSMISKSFIPGFVGFITSFLEHNSWFSSPIVLIDIDLNEQERQYCNLYYSNIIYKKPNKKAYKRVNWKKTQPHLWNTYYTLDIFTYKEYDRVVFIDLDILVLGDISELFFSSIGKKVGGVQAYYKSCDELLNYINAGVIVVNLNKISENFYTKIIDFVSRGYKYPEQDAINKYMRNDIMYLPKKYNVEKRMLFSKKYPFDIEEVLMLHFVALKPWQKERKINEKRDRIDFVELEKVWWEYYEKGVKK